MVADSGKKLWRLWRLCKLLENVKTEETVETVETKDLKKSATDNPITRRDASASKKRSALARQMGHKRAKGVQPEVRYGAF